MVRSPNHPCTHRGNDAHFVPIMTETGVQVIAETRKPGRQRHHPRPRKTGAPGRFFTKKKGGPRRGLPSLGNALPSVNSPQLGRTHTGRSRQPTCRPAAGRRLSQRPTRSPSLGEG